LRTVVLLLSPLLKPSAGRSRSAGPKGHERDLVRPGPGQRWPLRGPSETSADRGDPRGLRAQSPGCPLFRFLALGTQRKEPVVREWVSRKKASVRWTLGAANGLATDGKHRTCKREHGERSAASPVVNNPPVGDPSRRFLRNQ
ncbi:MAG: hypothetical protein ACE1Z4_03475, partial [Gammaproteobacteria bacterium]